MLMNPRITYLVLVLVSMLLSFSIKRAPRLATKSFPSASSARNFGFSFNSWNKNSHNQGSTSSEHSSSYSTASSAATSASSHNYESAALNSLKNYQIAVAFQPKNRTESNLFKKKHNKTSPALESPTGEDNLFVSAQTEKGYVALGVADGVGGWSEAGYDSSAISRELCASMKSIFEQNDQLTPKKLVKSAFEDITKSPKVEIGGTTACLGVLSPDRKLQVANLGDSWCGVFRDFKLIEQTKFQTHNFNTPYQLAKIPPQIIKQAESQGKRYIIDTPDMADEYSWNLQKDDLVIFATDGVTDNVVTEDMERFLKDEFDTPNADLSAISQKFVKEVVKVSKDPNFPSSFAQELSKLTGQRYLGGKEDDITVVIVKVA